MKKIEDLTVRDDASAMVDKVSGIITLENPTEKIVLDFPAIEVEVEVAIQSFQLLFYEVTKKISAL